MCPERESKTESAERVGAGAARDGAAELGTREVAKGTGKLAPVQKLADDVASMSKDIGDTVDVISRETDVVEYAARTHGSSSTRGAVRRIAQNVAYIERIASTLLDRADGNGLEPKLELIRLAPFVAGITDRLVCTHERHRVSCHAITKVVVWIDVLAIESVICRFVRNALLRAPHDAPIWVRVDGNGTIASVSVIDRAGGMSERACRELFDAPAKRDEDRAHCLHDCLLLIEAHRGRCGVDNAPGRGTRLYFEIPAFDDESAEPLLTAHVARRLIADELRVLVVDHSCSRAWPLMDTLRARGVHVAIAYDAAGFEHVVNTRRPDVLVVEVEAAAALKRAGMFAAGSQAIPVIALSWLPIDSPEVAALVGAGASYMPRPIDIDRLLARIATLVDR